MKSFLFAAALAVSIPAFAQDTTAGQPTPPPADASAPASDATMTPAPTDTTTTAPDATMPATQPDSSMTSQSSPGATSDPTGSKAAPTGGAMANAPAAGDPSTYPVCSRTVQDRCVNRSAGKSKRRG